VERAGAASAISETSSELGGALGIAIFGSIGTAVYRSLMIHGVPDGISFEAANAARSTLGAALGVAQRLPSPLGAELLDTARAAFGQAFELTAAISAVVSLATAIGAVLLLRGRRAGAKTEDEHLEPAVQLPNSSPAGS
jgi:DHA2 family multidrug resistance protein-like MFS transporter